MNNGQAIFRLRVDACQREPGAHENGKGGRNQAGFPSAIPRAHHHSDGEDDEAAFEDIGKQQRGNQRQHRAEHSHEVAQSRGAGGRNQASSQTGESRSHAGLTVVR